MNIIINLLVSTLAVVATAYILPGVHIANLLTALVVAILLGILNSILKPVLLILTLPINILTLGLFTFVVMGLIVVITSMLVSGFKVDSFGWALLFSLVLSLINSFLHHLSK